MCRIVSVEILRELRYAKQWLFEKKICRYKKKSYFCHAFQRNGQRVDPHDPQELKGAKLQVRRVAPRGFPPSLIVNRLNPNLMANQEILIDGITSFYRTVKFGHQIILPLPVTIGKNYPVSSRTFVLYYHPTAKSEIIASNALGVMSEFIEWAGALGAIKDVMRVCRYMWLMDIGNIDIVTMIQMVRDSYDCDYWLYRPYWNECTGNIKGKPDPVTGCPQYLPRAIKANQLK